MLRPTNPQHSVEQTFRMLTNMRQSGLKSDGNVLAGSTCIVLSAATFAIGGTFVKSVSPAINPMALLFWRNLLSAVLVCLWFTVRGWPKISAVNGWGHVLRAALTYGGLLTYFLAVRDVPLADAVLLRAAYPIFVPIWALLFYRRLSAPNVWLGVAVGFVGVACVLGTTASSWEPSLGALAGVASGGFGGAAAVAIWSMAGKEPVAAQMVYFALLSLILSALPLAFVWQAPSADIVPSLFAVALFTTAAQAFLAVGCSIAPADRVLPWGYTSVPIAALLAAAAWGESVTTVAVVGMALVVVGAQTSSRKTRSSGAQGAGTGASSPGPTGLAVGAENLQRTQRR